MGIDDFFSCDYHVHTRISPCARQEMVLDDIIRRAEQRGYGTIGISDHAYPETIDRLLATREQIDALDTDMAVYLGCEVDVQRDGTLPVDEAALAGLDYVLAAPTHSLQMFNPDMADDRARQEQLESWFRQTAMCCDYPVIDMIAHPLRGLRGGFEAGPLTELFDWDRVGELLDRLKAAGFALELLDSIENFRTAAEGVRRFYGMAVERGFRFSPGSDTHGLDRLGRQWHAAGLYHDLGLGGSHQWRPGQ